MPLTIYQPIVEVSRHFDHFHIHNVMFLVRSANSQSWFLQPKSIFDFSNLLPTYGDVFKSFSPLAHDALSWEPCLHIHRTYFLKSISRKYITTYPMHTFINTYNTLSLWTLRNTLAYMETNTKWIPTMNKYWHIFWEHYMSKPKTHKFTHTCILDL